MMLLLLWVKTKNNDQMIVFNRLNYIVKRLIRFVFKLTKVCTTQFVVYPPFHTHASMNTFDVFESTQHTIVRQKLYHA